MLPQLVQGLLELSQDVGGEEHVLPLLGAAEGDADFSGRGVDLALFGGDQDFVGDADGALVAGQPVLAEELGGALRHLLDVLQAGNLGEGGVRIGDFLTLRLVFQNRGDAVQEGAHAVQAGGGQVAEALQHSHLDLGVVAAAPVALDVQQEVGVVLAVALHLDNGAPAVGDGGVVGADQALDVAEHDGRELGVVFDVDVQRDHDGISFKIISTALMS